MKFERFIEENIYENIVVRISEIRNVDIDIKLLLDTIYEVVGDDTEALYNEGVYYDLNGDWISINVQKVLDRFDCYIMDEYNEDTFTFDNVKDFITMLKPYEKFTIFAD